MLLNRVADLGEIEGRVWLCGGPYSNLQATQSFAQRVTPSETVICTGDAVAYCADTAQTVALVRASGWHVIAGNCERELSKRSGSCGCGFAEGSACDLAAGVWYAHADAQLDEDSRIWMSALPDAAVFTQHGRRYGVIHGGASNISRFLWPISAEHLFREEIAQLTNALGPLDGVVAGHCGVAFARQIDGVRWINAGALGLPPHDGRPATRYAILSDGEVTFHRLDYDVDAAVNAMKLTCLDQGYDVTLRSGIWPSEDVLPPEMRSL